MAGYAWLRLWRNSSGSSMKRNDISWLGLISGVSAHQLALHQ